MSFFKGKNPVTANAVDPYITVSAETIATVSGRVRFESQIVAYETDPDSNTIALVTRANASDYSRGSKKGLVLVFDKNIKPGAYSVTDSNFPFDDVYYFETGTTPGFVQSYNYRAKSGNFKVEVVEVTAEKLHYKIDFDFKGVDLRNQELTIAGKSSYLVLVQSE
ncbi:hypothetical protein [Pseudomonas sp. SWRI99]|uniref:hypothetical protein n=1 Tax=Pseudomonas sp. SWRI99 TaxID=2745506 RepID=UPI001645CCE7|nr:hypothetical protein [Pseudomonas sp. SWRI99]MBC3775673.1 hypothetical protein [Pseudomonas sp. SWRI99]